MNLITSENEAHLQAPELLRKYLNTVSWQTAKELYETLIKVKPGLSVTTLNMALYNMSRNGVIAKRRGKQDRPAGYMLKE